jgi:hypothetical protein
VSIFVVDILGSSEDVCMTDELLLFNPKKAASNLQKTFEFWWSKSLSIPQILMARLEIYPWPTASFFSNRKSAPYIVNILGAL